jgi:tetrahydromethanopterin:alpha-L-glutamate ligase
MGRVPRIGIITAYPEEDWHSRQLMEAADRYGGHVVIRPETVSARVSARGTVIRVAGGARDGLGGCVLARGFGERGNPDFLIPAYQWLERRGMVLVNRIDALLAAVDKFVTSERLQQAGLPTPEVVVVQDAATGRSVLSEWGQAVAKPLYGSLGVGVERLEDTRRGRARLAPLLRRHGALYLQQYVPAPGRDIRAFVVGGAVAASMYRLPAPGQWVTNVARGGFTAACTLDGATARLAVAAAETMGLDYTGVDILEGPAGPVVIEVNGNPLWRGLLEATGRNMADAIIAWVVERIGQTTGKGGECVA